jgi:hypothetical protein
VVEMSGGSENPNIKLGNYQARPQFAELPECIAVSKLPGLDPVSGSAMAAPYIRSSPETRPPFCTAVNFVYILMDPDPN